MGVKKTHLAKKINVTAMTYTRMEDGKSKLDVEKLSIISTILGIEISVFFDKKLTESVIYEIEHASVKKQIV